MMKNDQSQSAAEGAAALQAGRDIVLQNGMTYQDVKEVARDVFETNFYRLALVAREEATARAEYITEKFLDRLTQEHPEGFQQANDPGFQSALFAVQKEHAKAGDEELGDLLVDLLVDRSKQKQRDFIQLVLDESIATAPKLTEGQLAILAVTFVLKYTQDHAVNSIDALGAYLDSRILPFAEKLVTSDSSFAHLDFTGCGSTSVMMRVTIEEILAKTYQGLFFNGLSEDEILESGLSVGLDGRVFMKCINNNSLFQVNCMRLSDIDGLFAAKGIVEDDLSRLKVLYDKNVMNSEQVRAKVVALRASMEVVFDRWSSSQMTSLSLTSVGMAVGHANVKRLVGNFGDLAQWIN